MLRVVVAKRSYCVPIDTDVDVFRRHVSKRRSHVIACDAGQDVAERIDVAPNRCNLSRTDVHLGNLDTGKRLIEVAERMFLAEGTDLKEGGSELLIDKESLAEFSR